MKYWAEFYDDDLEVTDVVEFKADDDNEAMEIIAEFMMPQMANSAKVEVICGEPDGYRHH